MGEAIRSVIEKWLKNNSLCVAEKLAYMNRQGQGNSETSLLLLSLQINQWWVVEM